MVDKLQSLYLTKKSKGKGKSHTGDILINPKQKPSKTSTMKQNPDVTIDRNTGKKSERGDVNVQGKDRQSEPRLKQRMTRDMALIRLRRDKAGLPMPTVRTVQKTEKPMFKYRGQ